MGIGVAEATVLMGMAVLFPVFMHFLPSWDDGPLGARLLPIFWAPLMAAFHFRLSLAVAFAALTPWVNHFLTGHPLPGMAALLMVELLLFAVWIRLLVAKWQPRWWMGSAAYLLTKPFSGLAIVALPNLTGRSDYLGHLTSALTRSWPGILLLALVGALAVQAIRTRAHD